MKIQLVQAKMRRHVALQRLHGRKKSGEVVGRAHCLPEINDALVSMVLARAGRRYAETQAA